MTTFQKLSSFKLDERTTQIYFYVGEHADRGTLLDTGLFPRYNLTRVSSVHTWGSETGWHLFKWASGGEVSHPNNSFKNEQGGDICAVITSKRTYRTHGLLA